MQNELARQIAEKQGSMHRSITSRTFSKSLSNSNSNNPVCFICLQNIKPNSKIHKKCVKQNCGSASKTIYKLPNM